MISWTQRAQHSSATTGTKRPRIRSEIDCWTSHPEHRLGLTSTHVCSGLRSTQVWLPTRLHRYAVKQDTFEAYRPVDLVARVLQRGDTDVGPYQTTPEHGIVAAKPISATLGLVQIEPFRAGYPLCLLNATRQAPASIRCECQVKRGACDFRLHANLLRTMHHTIHVSGQFPPTREVSANLKLSATMPGTLLRQRANHLA